MDFLQRAWAGQFEPGLKRSQPGQLLTLYCPEAVSYCSKICMYCPSKTDVAMPVLTFNSPPDTDERSPEAMWECPPEMQLRPPMARLSSPPKTEAKFP